MFTNDPIGDIVAVMSIERIFDEMEIGADPFALCELKGECTLGLGRQAIATLHYVVAGRGEIVFEGQKPIALAPGSLVLAPAHQSHKLRKPGLPGTPLPECKPAELNLTHHIAGRADSTDRLLALCSHVHLRLRGVGNVVDLIRQPIVEHAKSGGDIEGVMHAVLRELAAPALGSRALIRTLLLQCMIHLLRTRYAANDPAASWMPALVDERLWSALHRMLEKPGDLHTVGTLAAEAGMSRSTFARRFSAAYGAGAMALLRDLRMQHAASLLSRSDLPVKRVAELCGYKSRSYFTRTFDTAMGQSPQSFRRLTNRSKS